GMHQQAEEASQERLVAGESVAVDEARRRHAPNRRPSGRPFGTPSGRPFGKPSGRPSGRPSGNLGVERQQLEDESFERIARRPANRLAQRELRERPRLPFEPGDEAQEEAAAGALVAVGGGGKDDRRLRMTRHQGAK